MKISPKIAYKLLIVKRLSISFFIFAPFVSSAQSEAKTEVNIIVNDFFQLTSQRSDGQNVEMVFSNSEDFIKGISTLKQSQLLLSSTIYYNLVARAVLEKFRTARPLSFPASVLKVEVDNIGNKSEYAVLNSIEELHTNNQPLITNGAPLIHENVNIRYSISADKAQKYILKAGPGIYSNTIIYTLTPR